MTEKTRATAPPPHVEFFPPPRPAPAAARWLAGVAAEFRQLHQAWPIIHNMVVQDLRIRYHRSMLGFFWTLVNPILMMATLTVVFAQIMGTQWQEYAIYLFSGMVPWGLMAATLGECSFCIIGNEMLIRKIYLPKLVFPVSRLLLNLTTFVLSLGALFLLLIPLGARFSPPMVLLPAAIGLLAMFTLGLGLLVATANTFFRDCSHLVSVFLQAWYFATPIMYEAERFHMPPALLWLNPALPFIRIFQAIIRYGQWPGVTLFLVAAAVATASLGIGYATFKCYEDKLVFRL